MSAPVHCGLIAGIARPREEPDDIEPGPGRRRPCARDVERPAAATRDAPGALRQLDQLRTRGLITEAEFAAKRQDVLNRL
jgi:hypothetical protein